MDNQVKTWHANSGYYPRFRRNQEHMIERNMEYIGLGDDHDDYIQRCAKMGSVLQNNLQNSRKKQKKETKYVYIKMA